MGVAWVHTLSATPPDRKRKVMVFARKTFRYPNVRVGPICGVLRCSPQSDKGRLQGCDLRSRPTWPHPKELSNFTVRRKKRSPNGKFVWRPALGFVHVIRGFNRRTSKTHFSFLKASFHDLEAPKQI